MCSFLREMASTDINKSCPSLEFLISPICIFSVIRENKFPRKFLNLQYAERYKSNLLNEQFKKNYIKGTILFPIYRLFGGSFFI